MTHVTRMLTAKNWNQLRNPTLGNRVWATFTFLWRLAEWCWSAWAFCYSFFDCLFSQCDREVWCTSFVIQIWCWWLVSPTDTSEGCLLLASDVASVVSWWLVVISGWRQHCTRPLNSQPELMSSRRCLLLEQTMTSPRKWAFLRRYVLVCVFVYVYRSNATSPLDVRQSSCTSINVVFNICVIVIILDWRRL